MATNFIKIFDDTVIKMSVNQGLEAQRTQETLGTFTVGELAYTRDTGRLFVGDNSDGEEGHRGMQETVGGSIVGNKYLGLIDSKPLTTFYNNGIPLSYEHNTNKTGTQEASGTFEKSLLLAGSKFRLRSGAGADETWDNWNRYATYNTKYNAYNGDYMYDVYQNALILFDTHISGNKSSATQPQVKLGSDKLPVSPETFIVNGKEIRSDSNDALNVQRRSKLINYSKDNLGTENDVAVTNDSLVYGDGYVIIRNVEPDNQTIRFKPRSFQLNGLPETINNYTHNLLEVFHVPLNSFAQYFTDDFIVTDVVALNKKISYVQSITGGNSGNIKFPNDVTFSTVLGNGRDAQAVVRWILNAPSGVTAPSNTKYLLEFTPYLQQTDHGKTYIEFQTSYGVAPTIKPPYYIRLEGLMSNQANRSMLVIDKTTMDIGTAPLLSVKWDKNLPPNNFDDDPYVVLPENEVGQTRGFSGNYTIGNMGCITYIDEYPSDYYSLAKSRIDKWEEQNTSVNFLKVPVTIAQSSIATNLFDAIPAYGNANIGFVGSVATTSSGTRLGGDINKLFALAVAPGHFYYAFNNNPSSVVSNEDPSYEGQPDDTIDVGLPELPNANPVAFLPPAEEPAAVSEEETPKKTKKVSKKKSKSSKVATIAQDVPEPTSEGDTATKTESPAEEPKETARMDLPVPQQYQPPVPFDDPYAFPGEYDNPSPGIMPVAITAPTWSNMTLSIPPSGNNGGIGAIVTSNALPNNIHIKTITVAGEVSEIAGGVNMDHKISLFCALINNSGGVHVEKFHVFDQFFSNFTFSYTMDTQELLLSGQTYLAIGYLGESLASEIVVKFTKTQMNRCTVNAEQAFQLMPIGANILLDYEISPYLMCMQKIVSTPYSGVLPVIAASNQYPTENKNYFANFNATNVKVWNDLFCVLGFNHYGSWTVDPVEISAISSAAPSQQFDPSASLKKGAFISGPSFQVKTDLSSVVMYNAIDKYTFDECYLFSWYKEYTKSGSTEANVKYYPTEAFDVHSEVTGNKYITSVKLEGNNTELIAGGTGIISGAEEASPDGGGKFRKQYAIPITSTLWSSNEQYVAYVSGGVTYRCDLHYNPPRVQYSYSRSFSYQPSRVILYNANGAKALEVPGGSVDWLVSDDGFDYKVTADTKFNNQTINNFKYIAFVEPVTSLDARDIDPTIHVYRIAQNCAYISAVPEGRNLTNMKLWYQNKLLTGVTINEDLVEEDKVYIPLTARSLLLEVSYNTTQNSTIAIMYANNFDQLGKTFSGLPVEEFNNPGCMSTDLIVNPSHSPEINDKAYSLSNNIYKMRLGKSTAVTPANKQFHDINVDINTNKGRLPSIYAPAKNEKILLNTSSSGATVIEVPVHKDTETGERHFSLRIANVRPSNAEILNALSIRVIGFTS